MFSFWSQLYILQGESKLVLQLWSLISLTYVNISEYTSSLLITQVGDFVWGMKHHGTCKDASEKCKMHFWLIFKFCDFFPCFELVHLLFGLPWQDISSHDVESLIIPLLKSNSSFHCIAAYQEWPKLSWSLQIWAKNPQILKIGQKSV